MLGRFLRRSESRRREFLADEAVDGVSRHGRLHGRFERPVLAPDGAFGDPAAEEVDLGGRQPRLVRLGRRHELVLVVGHDALDQGADVGLARHERLLGQGRLPDVEPELGLAMRLVLAVAAETVIGEDGQDVPAEAHRLRREGGEDERQESAEQRGRLFHLGVILRRCRRF